MSDVNTHPAQSDITAEWIEGKHHYLFRQDGNKCAYAHAHGDGRRWDVLDRMYAKICEIPARTEEEAVARVTEMIADGSLSRMQAEKYQPQWEALQAIATHAEMQRQRDREAEFRPAVRGNVVQPITLNLENHRLLRAVALKRAQKNPGEQASISAVIEELVGGPERSSSGRPERCSKRNSQKRGDATVLTNNPHIVTARPPRRTRKLKPGPKITRYIVGPHEHELAPLPPENHAVPGKPAAKPAAVIVGRKVAPALPEEARDHARAEAAERLWREMVKRASQK